ncbi:MAG: hypothetical protein K2O15_12060, partial [Lachnospiraceae bacterium]|nr:hypothetical protein [Lachnospiraceae bacterium]
MTCFTCKGYMEKSLTTYTTDEILSLQDKVKCLEKENQYLKSLLDRAGISYHVSDEMKNRDLFDPDQGKRIIPREITD